MSWGEIALAPVPGVDEPYRQVSVKGKLLLVEDSEAQGAHIRATLERQGYEVLWATSGIEGLKLARSERPDLIVLDVVMQDMDGLAVCRWLKMSSESRDIPIIMLTVRGELQERVEGLNIGADDYLPKPFADEELEARIFAALRVKSAEIELKKRNSELQSMLHHVEALAITDPLTGLFNRRRFDDVLKREFAITKRYGTPLSCLMVDVDHFKRINDLYGHDAGDRVLCGVASRLTARLREVSIQSNSIVSKAAPSCAASGQAAQANAQPAKALKRRRVRPAFMP